MISTTTTTMIMIRWKAPIAFDDRTLFLARRGRISLVLVLSECIFSAWLDGHLPCVWDTHLSLFPSLFPNLFFTKNGGLLGGERGGLKYSFISKPRSFYFLSHPIDFTYILPLLRTLTPLLSNTIIHLANSSLQFGSLLFQSLYGLIKRTNKKVALMGGHICTTKDLIS